MPRCEKQYAKINFYPRDINPKMIYNKAVSKIIIDKEKISRILYIALIAIAGTLILLIMAGTIIGLARPHNAQPLLTLGGSARPGSGHIASNEDDIRVFSGLGRLRITLANSSIMLLSIEFPYSAGDTAFTEELAARIGDLRDIATGYFSALPEENVIQIDEEKAKQDILRMYNNSLRLGRIEALYFSEMTVIESVQ